MLQNTKPAEVWTRDDVLKGLEAVTGAHKTAEGMAKDWYNGLVYNAVGSGFTQVDHGDKKSVKELWAGAYEESYKAKHKDPLTGKEPKMPGAYRSAKSVICKAIRLNVELLNEDGTARGKTEVETECKELESNDKTNVDKITQLLSTVSQLIDKAKEESECLSGVQQMLVDLHSKCS